MRFASFLFIFFLFAVAVSLNAAQYTKRALYISAPFLISTPPQITSLDVVGYSGDIPIVFDLVDNDGNLNSITIEFKPNDGSINWLPATIMEATTNIAPGTGLSVTWLTTIDLPFADGTEYIVRISAYDGSAMSSWVESAPIHIINTYTFTSLAYDKVFSPKINNNGSVVWAGDFYAGEIHVARNIFLYDGADTIRLTEFDYYAFLPNINDLGEIVWNASDGIDGTPSTGTDQEIYLFNDVETAQLTSNDFIDNDAQINNNGYVTWAGFDGNDTEIFLFDGTTTTQLTDNAFDDLKPRINNNNHVVWSSFDGVDWEILFFDGTTTTNITDNTFDDTNAEINNIDHITWSGYDGSDTEIFLYDGVTTHQLTTNISDDLNPHINDNGRIIWQQWDGADWEIILYDTLTTQQITNNAFNDVSPKINEKDVAVWYGGEGSNSEIYIYDGSISSQITFDTLEDRNPELNDSNQLVWTRWNGTHWEIILAIPNNPALEILSIEQVASLIKLIWTASPNLPVRIFWTDSLTPPIIWDEIDGNALLDIIENGNDTASWTDRGVDPDMNGNSPANVPQRFYKIIGIRN